MASATQPQLSHLQVLSSTGSQHTFSDILGNHVNVSSNSTMQSLLSSFSRDGASAVLNMHETHPLVSSASSSKRIALESQLPSRATPFVVSQPEDVMVNNIKVSDLSSLLPPFPGRESFADYRGVEDNQSNELYGFTDSLNILPTGMSNMKDSSGDNGSLSIPYATSIFKNAVGNEYPLNSDMTTSSCVDESGFLQSSENGEQANPTNRTFVKVHKSGSFGRSLDISKFNSYHELRGELARMFGLEGLLEDPERSGWQLVFVDRENDVLLLGDDPWQEFVNNVWYIKILSPLEVQQMGKEGLDLPNGVQAQRLPGNVNGCDDYMNQKGSRNTMNGIPLGSLDY
ncbi:unnamed protein product [Withania somnifera]